MKSNIFRISVITVFLLMLLCVTLIFSACGEKKNLPQYEVAFESNGGTMYYSILLTEDDFVILPTPEKEGYEFLGWYDNADCTGEKLGEAYETKENKTLYAKWNAYEGTVKFESNGGTKYRDLAFYAQRVELPTPQKEGYIFSGWYADEKFAGEALKNSILPSGDMTLYAKWEAVTGSVVFESNGGTQYNRVDTSGQKVKLPTPAKEGYHFAGWYDNAEFSGNSYSGEIVPDGTITLYARWAINYLLISFEENGGVATSDIKLFDNDRLSLPTPSRWGYTFAGWYDNAELSGNAISEYFFYPSEDVTLYAKWEKCSYLYLYYGDTGMSWKRFEYPVGATVTLDEIYSLLSPDDIVITDYLGKNHICSFDHWAYEGYDKNSNIEVTSDVTIEGDYLILVAEYDDSEVPESERLKYDEENDIWTTTGKVAHLFIDAPEQTPYVYSMDLSFKKGTGGAFGPAFRMRVSDADYHYEGGCDYLAPAVNSSGGMYIARVLNGKWGNFVSSVSTPAAFQTKCAAAQTGEVIEVTISIVDYGTYFEIYIDNEFTYKYTNSTALASYPYTGLGLRSSASGVSVLDTRVDYGHTVSYESGVEGLSADPITWYCGYASLPNWTREGYAIEGWYYDEAFTQRVDDRTFSPTTDVTLYAKWTTEYDVVSFNANGGSDCVEVNYAAGKINLPTTTRMNYIFTGWYYDAELTKMVDAYNYERTGDTTLYAGWRLPKSYLTSNEDGSYTYTKKTEAVLGTLETGIPASGTYHEFSQTLTMTKGIASAGIAFRMNMNRDYTYETSGTYYISVQFAGGALRVSRVSNGGWARIIPGNQDWAFTKMPQNWQDKYNATADGGQITVTLMIRDYGSYFEAYVDGELAYTYGANGETTDLTVYTGNGYGIRCSAGSTVIFDDITASVVTK